MAQLADDSHDGQVMGSGHAYAILSGAPTDTAAFGEWSKLPMNVNQDHRVSSVRPTTALDQRSWK